MPWGPKDAPSHTKDAYTPRKCQVWADAANAELKKRLAEGLSQAEAEAHAIRVANAVVARIKEDFAMDPSAVTPAIGWALITGDASKLSEQERSTFEEALREQARRRAPAGVIDLGETLTEDAFDDAKQVDAATGVLRNVAVLRTTSLNNGGQRSYLTAALAGSVPLFEGCRVYADHPSRPIPGSTVEQPRSVRDLIGRLANVRLAEGVVRGDVQVLSSHRAWVLPLAKEAPDLCGLSWRGLGKVSRDSRGAEMIEQITRVRSADLVTEPAAVRNLFESTDGANDGAATGSPQRSTDAGGAQTREGVTEVTPQEAQALQEKVKSLETDLAKAREANTGLVARQEALETIERLRSRATQVRSMAAAAGITEEYLTEVFVQQAAALPAKDDADWAAKVKPLIEERRDIVLRATGKPVSGARQDGVPEVKDEQIAEAFKGH
jgi:hypothetical protein